MAEKGIKKIQKNLKYFDVTIFIARNSDLL